MITDIDEHPRRDRLVLEPTPQKLKDAVPISFKRYPKGGCTEGSFQFLYAIRKSNLTHSVVPF